MSLKNNNKTIALNILYVPHNTEEIRHAYKSKHNLSVKFSNSLNDYCWWKMALSCCRKTISIT